MKKTKPITVEAVKEKAEALANKICKEEWEQEPSEDNLFFRKVLVHGMIRWNDTFQDVNVKCQCIREERTGETEMLVLCCNLCGAAEPNSTGRMALLKADESETNKVSACRFLVWFAKHGRILITRTGTFAMYLPDGNTKKITPEELYELFLKEEKL